MFISHFNRKHIPEMFLSLKNAAVRVMGLEWGVSYTVGPDISSSEFPYRREWGGGGESAMQIWRPLCDQSDGPSRDRFPLNAHWFRRGHMMYSLVSLVPPAFDHWWRVKSSLVSFYRINLFVNRSNEVNASAVYIWAIHCSLLLVQPGLNVGWYYPLPFLQLYFDI